MFRLVIIGLFILGAISACQFSKDKTPSIIVITVENLGVQQVSCDSVDEKDENSGLQSLCAESIRFTHAFTTSPLSVSALASILTAQYPLEHGLRHHGLSFLSSTTETLAEKAHAKGIATAFFSGGAPVLRKHNLQQGFDIFEDNINLLQNSTFRPFEQSAELYWEWREDIGKQSSLGFFYVPDLLFPEVPTQNYRGETRDRTFGSQLEEFDEGLGSFIRKMKKDKLWDQSIIVLVGLNGPAQYPRPGELDNTSLFSDRTHVALLVKPAQKPRDEGINWTFDQNVSLADLGKTLVDLIGAKTKASRLDDFPVISLKEAFENLNLNFPERSLLLESAWGQWKEKTSIRYSIRTEQFLFIFDEKVQMFNSLIDRYELSPIKVGEPGTREILDKALRLQADNELPAWKGLDRDTELKWQVLSERLAHRLKDIPVIAQRYSQELLRQQRWQDLFKWADGMKLKNYQIVAQMNMEPAATEGLHAKLTDPCLRKEIKNCEDPLALHLLQWERDSKNEMTQRKFQRLYQQMRVDQSLSEKNWKLQGLWDISQETEKDLEITNLLLALPEMKSFR